MGAEVLLRGSASLAISLPEDSLSCSQQPILSYMNTLYFFTIHFNTVLLIVPTSPSAAYSRLNLRNYFISSSDYLGIHRDKMRKAPKSSARPADLRAEIRTRHLSNTKHEC
jgi:hypothetical protein